MTRRWFALGVLTLAVLLIGVDGTVLALATPFIGQDLGASFTQILWIGDIYSFVLAGLLISMGSLGDRIGHKKLLLCGATAFALVSVVTAYASSRGDADRGAGAARRRRRDADARHPRADPRPLSRCRGNAASPSASGRRRSPRAPPSAPFSAGILLEHFWWGSVFLINVPVMVVLLVGGIVLLPEHRNPEPGPWDLPSVGLSMIGMLGVVYGDQGGRGARPRGQTSWRRA